MKISSIPFASAPAVTNTFAAETSKSPARFGLFVHWGGYSGLSATWKGKKCGGDAAKERVNAHKGAGGTCAILFGLEEFVKSVPQGTRVTEDAGRGTLEPGIFESRLFAKEIPGEELMRLWKMSLKPVVK